MSSSLLRDAWLPIAGALLGALSLWVFTRRRGSPSDLFGRYQQIFEKTGSPAWLIDVETQAIVDANPAAIAFYGWPRAELVGRKVSDINTLPPDDISTEIAAAAADLRNSFTFRHRLASGEIRDVEVHSNPIVLGGRRHLYSIIHDITERRRAEVALAASEARYRELLDKASDAIFHCEGRGRIIEVNTRGQELLDFKREELIGREFSELIPSADLEAEPDQLPSLQCGRSILIERRLRRKNGTLVNVEISATVLPDGILQASVRDITTRRQLEEQLLQAQKLEAVGKLTGGLAHHLNNLLTIVIANGDLLAEALPPGDTMARADLLELQSAARRGASTIRKLLGFSATAPLNMMTLDFAALIAEFFDTLPRLLPENIAVAVFHDASGVKVRADAGALEQIIMNLATNARDAMPNGGHLRLESRRIRVEATPAGCAPGEYACLSVTDDGVGMDEYTRGRAFEPFFTTKPLEDGGGLGMAMIYGLVQQHGGFVELESRLGRGTTVRVFLPVVTAEPRKTPAGQRVIPRGETEHILLVEDEVGLRRVAERALRRQGYRVTTAADGQEALQLFHAHEHEIDLIVTDVIMPRLSGLALCRQLRSEGKTVRFLFTTGYAAHEISRNDLPEGELVLLQKPWSLAELSSKVREVLDADG